MKTRLMGLSAAQVLHARAEFGTNALEKRKKKSFLENFFENLSDPIIRILLIATALRVILSMGHCNWFEIGGILLTVFIAATVTTLSEWGSERAFEKMENGGASQKACVLRDGNLMEICVSDVVVGDILHIGRGDCIVADGVLIEGSLSVNQSALNGETLEVHKIAKDSNQCSDTWSLDDPYCVYRGSIVTEGGGVMRVGRVGTSTFYGSVARDVQSETRESPLKMRLSRLAGQISRIGYVMAGLVAVTNLFFTLVVSNHFSKNLILADILNVPHLFSILLHAFSLMITVVVVAVPEGLPMMITVVLSSNMKKMQRNGVMVKKMVGIETAGSLNILFTDKTGTLTGGNLVLDFFFHLEKKYKSIGQLRDSPRLHAALCLSSRYNTDCVFGVDGPSLGNQTDRAIGAYFFKESIPRVKPIERLPFDSGRKYATATVEYMGRRIRLLKGAPEIVLQLCDRMIMGENEEALIDASRLLQKYKTEAGRGRRILAFAYQCEGEAQYCFLCFASLRDALRTGVKKAVSEVQGAGVQVVMMTGDGEETAVAVAAECGILRNHSAQSVLSGEKLRAMTDAEVSELLPNLRVICRAVPEDKMRLVCISQSAGLVVGMTGDGINDAPALKKADVGFSMGSGTDIAKSASDIVLLNDHFSTIGKTILYGRTIFHSIRKFVSFQLMMNLAACGVSFLGQFIGIENPITIVQMLWVNLIMDTLGGLAFAGEPPVSYYMKEKPKRREEPILTEGMKRQIFITGGFSLLICILYLKGLLLSARFDPYPESIEFLTGFFALFIFTGIFNCIHARSDRLWIFRGIFGNRPFLLIISAVATIQLCIIYYGGTLFRSVPLGAEQLISIVLLSFSVIPFEFLRRIFRRLSGK